MAKGIMQEDPLMTKYTTMIARATQGERLSNEEKEYLHVMNLLEKRDLKQKYGEIYMEDESEESKESKESAKYAKIPDLENKDSEDTRW